MEFTSLRRVKLAYGITDNAKDAILARLISSGSRRIANWLRRVMPDGTDALELISRTEYFSPQAGQKVYYPAAYPISSITSLDYDATGLYAGNQALMPDTNYVVAEDLRSIHLIAAPPSTSLVMAGLYLPVGAKSVRLIHTAGLAVHPVVSVYAVTASVAMTVGYYVQGSLSGFLGYITAASMSSMSMEILAGIPQVGETLNEYVTLNFDPQKGGPENATDKTAVLGAATTRCLSELYPDLVEGSEMHVEYMLKNRNDFTNAIVSRNGENRISVADMQKDFFSIPQVRDLLDDLRNKLTP